MTSVIERLEQATALAEPITLSSLGSLLELEEAAAALAARPEAPNIASAFCDQLHGNDLSDEYLSAFRAFAAGLAHQKSYLALRETADILLNNEEAVTRVSAVLHDALLPDDQKIAGAPLLAGLCLDIVLDIVASTNIAPYQLLTRITAPVENYPTEFCEPLARSLGVAADIWTSEADRDRFTANLDALIARGDIEASYERTVLHLRDALAEADKGRLLSKIQEAQDSLNSVAESVEARDDAIAFAETCAALIAFDRADSAALSTAAEKARNVAQRRARLTLGMHQRHRTVARHTAELAWTSLAWRLETAASELHEEAFLDTWVAVDAIIEVYEADRQLTNLRTVSALIRPRLVNSIARRAAMTHQLARAVEIDQARDQPALPSEINELLELVQQARAVEREVTDAPEEPSHPAPYLQALLGPASNILGSLSSVDRLRLEAAAQQHFAGSLSSDRPVNELVERLTAKLLADLGENESFKGSARANFSLLVLQTVKFLVFVGDHVQPYTKPLSKLEKTPQEVELQKHFHQFLSGTELVGRVGMEHEGIAGGRADVITTFDGAQRYVTEVKRELTNATAQHLEDSYLTQAVEYQSTNEPFGQLLVLDLTDHRSGTPHINDSIWVVHRRDDRGRIVSSSIVAVVRGNRPTPSRMKGQK